MIKKTVLIGLMVCLVAGMAFAFSSSVSTGKISSTQQAVSGPGALTGITIRTDGTNAVTVTLYDSVNSTTDEIWSRYIEGDWYAGNTKWTFPLLFKNGLYVVISGTGGYCYIEYAKN